MGAHVNEIAASLDLSDAYTNLKNFYFFDGILPESFAKKSRKLHVFLQFFHMQGVQVPW